MLSGSLPFMMSQRVLIPQPYLFKAGAKTLSQVLAPPSESQPLFFTGKASVKFTIFSSLNIIIQTLTVALESGKKQNNSGKWGVYRTSRVAISITQVDKIKKKDTQSDGLVNHMGPI